MDTDDTIQVRSFSFDLSEALKTFLKLCPSESPAAQVCDRYLRLAVRHACFALLGTYS